MKKGKVSEQGKQSNDWTWVDFKQRVRNFLLYGVPATDKKGHSESIHYRVIPFALDLFSEVRAAFPEGWLRDPSTGKAVNNSTLHRIIFIVGCEVILQLLREDEKVDNVYSVLHSKLLILNEIRKRYRLSELQSDVENLQEEIIRSTMKDKTEIVNKIEEIKKEVFEILNK
jgi:hypothetical protein